MDLSDIEKTSPN